MPKPKGLGHVYSRGRIWWIKYYVNGEPRFESSGSANKTDATNLLKKRLVKPKRTANLSVTVDDLLEDLRGNYRARGLASYDTFAVPITKHLSRGLGPMRATKVSPTILKAYVNERQEGNTSNGSINRELSVLRRAFNLAAQSGKLDREAVPNFGGLMLRENSPRKGFLEPEQYRNLLTTVPEYLKAPLVIGYHTGLRKAKVLGLQIQNFDLALKKIYLRDEGTATKKVAGAVPIYGDMTSFVEEWIARTRAEYPDCHLFCHHDGRRITDFRKAWAHAAKEAGVEGLLFHDLRRSAVRNMERAGIPRSVAMKISGHKTESVYRRYDIVSEKDIDLAGERLGAYLGVGK